MPAGKRFSPGTGAESPELPLELSFRQEGSELKGAFTSRTLGGLDIPLRSISLQAPDLQFELPSDAGVFRFRGRVRGDSLVGNWDLFGLQSQVILRRAVAESPRYRQHEVTCRNGDVTLAGTLFIPTTGRSPHPAIVFLHGSGTVTRDADRFLADHFARRGVATLIFDKRGSGASTGDWHEANFHDLARDALAWVDLLKLRADVDATKIGLMGASQAGWVAPLAASKSPRVAFLALISGPTVPVAREGWWDAEFRLRERGFAPAQIEQALRLLRMDDEVTRTGRGMPELQAALDGAKGEPWYGTLGLGTLQPADSPSRLWYRRVIDFDPLPVLEKLSVPSLWIYGEQDPTIPAAESVAILERLKTRSKTGKQITVDVFPEANHTLYVMPKEGQPFRWPGFAAGYLDTLTAWVLHRVSL